MDEDIDGLLDRADELLRELETEYQKCLTARSVSTRAQSLTHEVLERLRTVLDQAMHRVWEKLISPHITDDQRNRATVYFPIASDLNSFRSTVGRGFMSDLDSAQPGLYSFLISKQPFSAPDNSWLRILSDLAAQGKHVRLAPQVKHEQRRVTVTGAGGSVSWDPSGVRFGAGVTIVGAPVNPATQRIVPTPGVEEKDELWVSFLIDGYNVNAMIFCKQALDKTRDLVTALLRYA